MSSPMVVVRGRTSKRLADRLARVAKRNRRTIAEELRIAIESHVAQEESKRPAGAVLVGAGDWYRLEHDGATFEVLASSEPAARRQFEEWLARPVEVAWLRRVWDGEGSGA